MEFERLMFRPPSWYKQNRIEHSGGTRATCIDRVRKLVVTDSGREFAFDKLLIATGAGPRPIPGQETPLVNLHYLRSSDNADVFGKAINNAKRLAILGGGYIGLEVAAVAVRKRISVTLFEQSDRILGRIAAPQTSDFIRALHPENGVEIIEGARATLLYEGRKVTSVRTGRNRSIPSIVSLLALAGGPIRRSPKTLA